MAVFLRPLGHNWMVHFGWVENLRIIMGWSMGYIIPTYAIICFSQMWTMPKLVS